MLEALTSKNTNIVMVVNIMIIENVLIFISKQIITYFEKKTITRNLH